MTEPRRSFHVTIHTRPTGSWPCRTLRLDGLEVPALEIPQSLLGLPFPISFEDAREKLSALPRLFIEPDGAMVWVSSDRDQPWQIDGTLFDRNGRLLYVELKGSCSTPAFDELLERCGATSRAACMVQLVRQAAVVEVEEFRRLWLAG